MLFKNKFISGYCPRCTWQQSFCHEGIMFRKKHSLIKGTLILTSAGLVSRVLGFFFRIFLSHTFGEEQVGLYQLIFPFYALCLSLSTSGLETAISRSVSRFHSLGRTQDGKLIFQTGLILSVLISLICTFFQIVFLEIQDVQHYYI